MKIWLTCHSGGRSRLYQSCHAEEENVLHYVRGHLVRVQVMEWHGLVVGGEDNNSDQFETLKLFRNLYLLDVYHDFLGYILDNRKTYWWEGGYCHLCG